MRPSGAILVVDDEPSIADAMNAILGEQSHKTKSAASVSEAIWILKSEPFDVVFADLRLPDGTGIDLLEWIRVECGETQVILMTAHGSVDVTIDAIKKGAYYYIEKPFVPNQVVALAERALERVALTHAKRTLRMVAGQSPTFGMIGNSLKMRSIYDTIQATKDSDASVLVEGDSGTGKELIATAFHVHGRRSCKPFVNINCAAIPSELIESELFGYKKGAFTGADRDKRGLIQAASGGTLLLDEITEMPLHLQAKLLRVVQERKIRRLGDEREIETDFRLISATNRDARAAIKEGRLREDLYFRIGTIRIKVPSLRDRIDDLVLLAEYFLRKYSRKYNKTIKSISEEALDALLRYDWPGNVRELESTIECAVLFCQSDTIKADSLVDRTLVGSNGKVRPSYAIPPFLSLEEIEREAIVQTLERTGGNIRRAAQILKVHRPTFYRKLRK
ncbi:MAG TPA: sigma-54 dependent transcriptional regulator, partial [Blastocatellia bacterium]|nr:sigma-54 dependent transcriptional regulator [Blastocatellia bacterium]